MLEDKFKFTRANIILIVINCILVIFVFLAAIQLIFSLKDKSGEIPELKTTAGKSSTLVADGTSTTSTETTTTTTKKVGNENSPYYDIDIYSIINKDLNTKINISKEEKIELGKQYFQVLDGILNPNNDNLLNINYLLTKVKPGENDKISINGKDYGLIYNGGEFFKSIMNTYSIEKLKGTKIRKVQTVHYDDNTRNFYKLGGVDNGINYKIINYEFQSEDKQFTLKVIYSNPDEKKVDYKSASISLDYNYGGSKWEIVNFKFPYED